MNPNAPINSPAYLASNKEKDYRVCSIMLPDFCSPLHDGSTCMVVVRQTSSIRTARIICSYMFSLIKTGWYCKVKCDKACLRSTEVN